MFKWFFAALLLVNTINLRAEQPTQDGYLWIYVKIHDGDKLEKSGDYLGAFANYKVALVWLQKLHDLDPAWEQTLVLRRIKDLQDKIVELKPLAIKQVIESNKGTALETPPLLLSLIAVFTYKRAILMGQP